MGKVFKKKVAEMLLDIHNVPVKAAIVNQVARAEADF